MSFSSLVKRWFGKRQGTIIRKKSGRKPVRLMLEILEDRLAPTASVSLANGVLSFTADPNVSGVTITVTQYPL